MLIGSSTLIGRWMLIGRLWNTCATYTEHNRATFAHLLTTSHSLICSRVTRMCAQLLICLLIYSRVTHLFAQLLICLLTCSRVTHYVLTCSGVTRLRTQLLSSCPTVVYIGHLLNTQHVEWGTQWVTHELLMNYSFAPELLTHLLIICDHLLKHQCFIVYQVLY